MFLDIKEEEVTRLAITTPSLGPEMMIVSPSEPPGSMLRFFSASLPTFLSLRHRSPLSRLLYYIKNPPKNQSAFLSSSASLVTASSGSFPSSDGFG